VVAIAAAVAAADTRQEDSAEFSTIDVDVPRNLSGVMNKS
jgi:hypothetical protein